MFIGVAKHLRLVIIPVECIIDCIECNIEFIVHIADVYVKM